MANKYPEKLRLGLETDAYYIFAISGGIDSMSLLSLAAKEGLRGKVVTVDHNLRAESLEDALFVKAEAAKLGYQTEIISVNVKAEAERSGESEELAARRLRHAAISECVKRENACGAVFAHHLGDQAETVLMRILRGTGVGGLKGMGDREGVFRPLLKYTSDEIKAYAEENGVPYREDYTNAQSVYRRNFLRNEVFPKIAEVYPDFERAFERLAENAAETEDYLSSALIAPETDGERATFDITVLEGHAAIWKRSIRAALFGLGMEKDVERQTYETIFALRNKNRASVDIGQGFIARTEYGKLIFERKTENTTFYEEFRIEKSYEFCGRRYEFREADGIKKGVTMSKAALGEGGLVVRTRREGDSFKRYKGGRKSLSDYLTDIKMPQSERAKVLVLAKDSEIYAVLGVEVSDIAKVDGGAAVEVVVSEV